MSQYFLKYPGALSQERKEGTAVDPSGPCKACRKTGILVVDGNSVVCTLLKTALEIHGFAVWTVTCGTEAVQVYMREYDLIDLVLIDLRMTDFDGPQTLITIKQLGPQLPCCFMTADAANFDAGSLFELGAAHLFKKPFHLADLAKKLRELTALRNESAG